MAYLTIHDIDSRRADSEPLSTAIAAYTSSEVFKSAFACSRPAGKSLSHLFNQRSRDLAGSELKKTANQPSRLSVIPLGTGRPNADFYPWKFLELGHQESVRQTSGSDAASLSSSLSTNIVVKRGGVYDLARGLNYSHAAGSQPLVRLITEHVEIVHNPPYRNWTTCLTCGSTSAFAILLQTLCDSGDTILTERYSYTGAIESVKLAGGRVQGIEMDADGLLPDQLDHTLLTWNETQGPRPKILYTIPSGQNPTGATQPPERRQAIYQVAEKYDLIIVEDDPYFFLPSLCTSDQEINSTNAAADKVQQAASFLRKLPSSFLSIDRSGRVVRLDSTSKILAPGLRAGWITASDEFIEKFIIYSELSTNSVSGPTQLMLWDLLDVKWGHAGFFCWLDRLSHQYRTRLSITLQACDKYLPKNICEWTPPQSGMFLWIKLDIGKFIGFRHCGLNSSETIDQDKQCQQIESNILSKALENGVQVTKGSLFDTKKTYDGRIYFRLTYAAASEADLDNGVLKFANAVREELGLEEVVAED